MYKLLIVDDEVAVVNGFAFDIDWSELRIDEIFRATSSLQALELLKKDRVDIVISDIRMPEMSGLELSAEIREQWPLAKVILISGYDEFEYAQKAIDLKVFSYVMKPASYEEIQEVVGRALLEMEKELEQVKALEEARKKEDAMLPILQERFMNAWIYQGKLTPIVCRDMWMDCRVPLQPENPAFLVLVRTDGWVTNTSAGSSGFYEVALRNLMSELLMRGGEGIMFRDPDDNLLALIQAESVGKLQDTLQYVAGMAETFQTSARRSLNCILSVFWGEGVDALKELPASYRRIRERMSRCLTLGSGVLSGPGKRKEPQTTGRLSKVSMYPPFSLLVESCQKEGAVERLQEIFRELEGMGQPSPECVLEVYQTVSSALLQNSMKRGISLSEWAGGYESLFYGFDRIKSLTALKAWAVEATCGYIEFVMDSERNQTDYLIEKAKKIILQLMSEEFSLAELASYLYLHPNYLSRIFKEQEGISIMDYVIKLRMEKARELLREAGNKVYEVAEKVGYESVAHFNRIFKRETGMTPKEYQVMSSGGL